MDNSILLDKGADGIALLTLNRPQAMNAIDRTMTGEMRSAIADIEADAGIRVLVVTGAGEKAFCVGIDLKERQAMSDAEADHFRQGELFPMYRELDAMETPAIAVVNGHALGGGFEIALACDLILATGNARFGLPEVKWGLIPAAGGCTKLPKLIGAARAKEIILTARTVLADEAERLGIINRVVDTHTRLDAARELASQIAAHGELAVRAAKRCIDHALDAPAANAYDVEASNLCYGDAGRKDGIATFGTRKA
jgi:enoyl-CoA hydratase/carnithine racemase